MPTIIISAAVHGEDAAFLSARNIAREVADRRAAINDLYVEFVFEVRHPRENQQVYEHRTVMMQGERFWSWREYDLLFEDGVRTAERAVSYDGRVETVFMRSAGMDIATLGDSLAYEKFKTSGTGFFDLMLYFPCHQVRGEPAPAIDLVKLLESRHARVRSHLEEVDGAPCHVVEVDAPDGSRMVTVWIDPARGFLPVRHDHYQPGHNQSTVRFTIDEAIELSNDVWMPVRGHRAAPARDDVPELRVGGETRIMTVDHDPQTGQWHLAINLNPEPQDFVLVNHLPPGTVVSDVRTNERWIVSFEDYDVLSEAVVKAVPVEMRERLRQASTSGSMTASPSSWPSRALPWLIVVLLAVVMGAYHGYRGSVHSSQPTR